MKGYDPSTDPDPDLSDAFKALKKQTLAQITVCVPAVVTEYNGDQTIDAMPLFKGKYDNKDVVDPPPATKIPVLYMRSGGYFLWSDPQKGDRCVLVSVNSSLEEFLSGAKTPHLPFLRTKFGHSDRFAVMGGQSDLEKINPPAGLSLGAVEGLQINILDGKISISFGSTELLNENIKDMQNLLTFFTSISGFAAPIVAAQVSLAAAKLGGNPVAIAAAEAVLAGAMEAAVVGICNAGLSGITSVSENIGYLSGIKL